MKLELRETMQIEIPFAQENITLKMYLHVVGGINFKIIYFPALKDILPHLYFIVSAWHEYLMSSL